MAEDRPNYCSGTRSTCKCTACLAYHAHRIRARRARLKGIPTPPPRNEPRMPYVAARWGDFALCKGSNTDMFFTENRGRYGATEQAKRICRQCQAVDDCLTYAIEGSEGHGVWGGLATKQRQQLGNRTVELETKILRAQAIRLREAEHDKSSVSVKRSRRPLV